VRKLEEDGPMKTLGKAFIQRLREILYLFLSFPISVIFFVLVLIGFNSSTFIPIGIALFLLVLSAMEYVAKFEVRRTNWLLGTDFKVVENWFGNPLLSWDGVKERVTSTRVWLAVAYVFVSFGWSLFSFVLVTLGIAGFLLLLASIGVATLSSFTRSFEVIDNGDFFRGNITFDESLGRVRLELGDASSSGFVNWDLYSNWVAAIAILVVFFALWIIPRNARAMAEVTEGFLSGTLLPKFEERLTKIKNRRKVSERDVREALAKESLQPQLSELSRREIEILALMAQGKSNAGIAKSLYITEGSVEKHISSILSKLELNAEAESHRRVLAVLKYLGIDSNNGKLNQ
jgi:DNA-binding CsgD family transcriptional regulator